MFLYDSNFGRMGCVHVVVIYFLTLIDNISSVVIYFVGPVLLGAQVCYI